jgi:hypothetical protein
MTFGTMFSTTNLKQENYFGQNIILKAVHWRVLLEVLMVFFYMELCLKCVANVFLKYLYDSLFPHLVES